MVTVTMQVDMVVANSGNASACAVYTVDGSNFISVYCIGKGTSVTDETVTFQAPCNMTGFGLSGYSNPDGGGSICTGGNSVFQPYNGTLPIELISFNVSQEENNVSLNWNTATEENNYGFSVEHSTDGITFSEIDWIEGNGTTSVENEYSYVHDSPSNGTNYYRLVQEDYDGTTTVLGTKTVQFSGVDNMSVYPNPVEKGQLFTIAYSAAQDKSVSIEVLDVTGKLVQTIDENIMKGMNQIEVNQTNLTKGLYFVRVKNQTNTKVIKFIITE